MSSVKKTDKRQQFRIRPGKDHAVSVDINGKNFIEVTTAADISESGIGIEIPGGLKNCDLFEKVSVVITLPFPENKIFQLNAVVTYLRKNRFGFRFTDPEPEVTKAIRQYILYLLKQEPLGRQILYSMRRLYRKIFRLRYMVPLFLILFATLYLLNIDRYTNTPGINSLKNMLGLMSDTPQKDIPAGKNTDTQKSISTSTGGVISESDKENLKRSAQNHLYPGIINVIDINNDAASEILTIASKNGWVAIPTELCVSAVHFSFVNRYDESIEIDKGLFRERDTAGLWRLQSDSVFDSPELKIWNPELPLRWHPVASEKSMDIPSLSVFKTYSVFTVCNLPDSIKGPGIFTQAGHIVGWTFQQITDQAFMLNMENPVENTDVEQFYQKVFAGKREEFFLKANKINGEERYSEKLALYVQGLTALPGLEAENTPDDLYRELILDDVNQIISHLYDASDFINITEILTAGSVIEQLSSSSIIRVIQSYHDVYGAERAVDFSRNLMLLVSAERNSLIPLHLEWIDGYLFLDNIYEAIQACDYSLRIFPDNPEFVLKRAELYIQEAKWEEALKKLNAIDYPEDLKAKADSLKQRIRENTGEPDQIVINFQPETGLIETRAFVNGITDMNFLIDTGASNVSVPLSLTDDLGIIIDSDTQVKTVQTAGGIVNAYEITLSSIEIDGISVYDITAYVLDMEDQENGLLGMNFIQHFQMELDNENGRLYLTPKAP